VDQGRIQEEEKQERSCYLKEHVHKICRFTDDPLASRAAREYEQNVSGGAFFSFLDCDAMFLATGWATRTASRQNKDSRQANMSWVEINNVKVVNNPAAFLDPIQFEIVFECRHEIASGTVSNGSAPYSTRFGV
jgi:hypothetical protein